MYPTLTNFSQGKGKTYDVNDLLALSLFCIIVYPYSLGKKVLLYLFKKNSMR